ncbi:TPA: RNA-binding protein [Candidatus Woesearchaeota archaeon]|nr:RNA-binding protein [Candidatus Woesearchaeota archaeon]
MDKLCTSCKRKVVNDKGSVSFRCPQCTNYDFVRCASCRTIAVKFACPNCSFIGPN